MKDFLGNTISIGDRVLYATVAGRSPVLKTGVVERLESSDETRHRWVDGSREEYYIGVVWKVGIRYAKASLDWTRNVGKQLAWPNPANVVYIGPPEV